MKTLRWAALILGVLVAVGCRQPRKMAPDFTLQKVGTSQPVTLSVENQTTPVLLVFWATWCPSCVDEIPHLNELYERYPQDQLRILSINVQESAKDVQTFMKKQAIRYPVLLDEKGEVAAQYGLVGIPASVMLAKGGEILYYGFSLPNVDQWLEPRSVQ